MRAPTVFVTCPACGFTYESVIADELRDQQKEIAELERDYAELKALFDKMRADYEALVRRRAGETPAEPDTHSVSRPDPAGAAPAVSGSDNDV